MTWLVKFVILKISQFDWKHYDWLTLSPRSKISSAFGPLTVQWTAIFSLRRIPKDRTVYLALEKTGCWPVKDSKTCNKINFEGYESYKCLDPFLQKKLILKVLNLLKFLSEFIEIPWPFFGRIYLISLAWETTIYLCCSRKPITRFSYADVKAEFANFGFPHGILGLGFINHLRWNEIYFV